MNGNCFLLYNFFFFFKFLLIKSNGLNLGKYLCVLSYFKLSQDDLSFIVYAVFFFFFLPTTQYESCYLILR